MDLKYKKYKTNNRGQVTIDYLISITIFLFAIFFLFQYISGLFTPFESNSDEVTLLADRVSTLVVENIMSAGDVAVPNLVTSTDTDAFFTLLNVDYGGTCTSLGLDGTYVDYDVNVTMENESSGIIKSAGAVLPSVGNVGQTKRIVLFMDADTGVTEKRIVSIRVW
ncbi:MAG: hypothetical protein K0A90_03620 [Methanosarcinaceae archaeon]|nr:hypothetical protein [Methanosarcinaceae archaeon]